MTAGKDLSVGFVEGLGELVKEPVEKVVHILSKKFKNGPPEDEPHKEGNSVVY